MHVSFEFDIANWNCCGLSLGAPIFLVRWVSSIGNKCMRRQTFGSKWKVYPSELQNKFMSISTATTPPLTSCHWRTRTSEFLIQSARRPYTYAQYPVQSPIPSAPISVFPCAAKASLLNLGLRRREGLIISAIKTLFLPRKNMSILFAVTIFTKKVLFFS